jgi:UDP-glucose 4-epimerase
VTTYLVTGGAGFIGSHLVTRLVNDGHQVRVLDNFSTGSRVNLNHLDGQVDIVEGDMNDPVALASAIANVEIVFHLAALASVPFSVQHPLETHHACATGTIRLLDACRLGGVHRLIYGASSSAYGDRPQLPKSEDQLPQVLSPYAAAKLSAELYCEAFAATYDLETVRIRYFNVFGPRQDPGSQYAAVVPLFVSALLSDRQPLIYGDGRQSRDFTYVDNVIHANVLAATAEGVSGNVYNAACGSSTELLDLLQRICKLLDKPFEPRFADPRIGDIRHSWADISAAQRDLRYSVKVPLDEGLRRTIEWYTGRDGPAST